MICSQCGSKLPDNVKFCGFCGAKVEITESGNEAFEKLYSEKNIFEEEKIAEKQGSSLNQQTEEKAGRNEIGKTSGTGTSRIKTEYSSSDMDGSVQKSTQIAYSDSFVLTKKIARVMEIDENHKLVKFIAHGTSVWFGKEEKERIYKYKDIVGYELIENNGAVTKGGFGGTVAGGLMFGGLGAVAGSVLGKKKISLCNNMSVRITVNDSNNPMVNIPLIVQPTKTNSMLYQSIRKTANTIISQLQYICSINDSEKVTTNVPEGVVSAADEIMKFKNLLDAGIITQSECDIQKKELLSL